MKHSPALAYVNQCSIVLFLVTLMAPAEAIFCYLQVALPQNLPSTMCTPVRLPYVRQVVQDDKTPKARQKCSNATAIRCL